MVNVYAHEGHYDKMCLIDNKNERINNEGCYILKATYLNDYGFRIKGKAKRVISKYYFGLTQ